MAIFYIEDENGTYISSDKKRKFKKLTSAAAYAYLQSDEGKGKRFAKTETEEVDGEVVFVELPSQMVKEYRIDERREQYVADYTKAGNFTLMSLNDVFDESCGDDITGEEAIADPTANTGREALKHLDLITLRMALSTLSEEEYSIIQALYLSDTPISVRKLSEQIGIPRMTLNDRKNKIIKKLRNFFEFSQKKSVQSRKKCGIQSEGQKISHS